MRGSSRRRTEFPFLLQVDRLRLDMDFTLLLTDGRSTMVGHGQATAGIKSKKIPEITLFEFLKFSFIFFSFLLKKKLYRLSFFLHLRRLVFDQSSQVHPVSESSGGSMSVTYGGRTKHGNPCV